MKEGVLKKILGGLLMATFVILTVMYIKKLPPLMKVMMLAVDVCVFYISVNVLIKPKKENKDEQAS